MTTEVTTIEPSMLVEATVPTPTGKPSQPGEPTWEIASLHPRQGDWTEREYLRIVDGAAVRIEFVDGCLEFLPMGSLLHAFLVDRVLAALREYCRDSGAPFHPLTAPLPTRLRRGEYRDPDLLLLRSKSMAGSLRRQPTATDVAMVLEFVSPGDDARERDYRTKWQVYAEARIEEYWIVDPDELQITVFRLEGDAYVLHGEFGRGTKAVSVLLAGFDIDVTELFTAAGEIPSGESSGTEDSPRTTEP